MSDQIQNQPQGPPPLPKRNISNQSRFSNISINSNHSNIANTANTANTTNTTNTTNNNNHISLMNAGTHMINNNFKSENKANIENQIINEKISSNLKNPLKLNYKNQFIDQDDLSSTYNLGVILLKRQFDLNNFNVSYKYDLFYNIKNSKNFLKFQFDNIQRNLKSDPNNSNLYNSIDWKFWSSIINKFSNRFKKFKSLKNFEKKLSLYTIPPPIKHILYLFVSNSKSTKLESIYNRISNFFNNQIQNYTQIDDENINLLKSKYTYLILKIENIFNLDHDTNSGNNSDTKTDTDTNTDNNNINKDMLEILRNFWLYYEKFNIIDINDPKNKDYPNINLFKQFYLPSKTIILICNLFLKKFSMDLSNSEMFSLLITIYENYFNFNDNDDYYIYQNFRNSTILSSHNKNLISNYNKDKLTFIFNRSLEQYYPELLLYLSSHGIHSNLLVDYYLCEFFFKISKNKSIYSDKPPELPKRLSKIQRKRLTSLLRSNGQNLEIINYDLNIDDLFKLFDMVLFEGIEYLIRFILLIFQKNYYKIFKIEDGKKLLQFLKSNEILTFLKDEKFVEHQHEVTQDQFIQIQKTEPDGSIIEILNNYDDDNQISKQNNSLNSDQTEKNEEKIKIKIKTPKKFNDFIKESFEYHPYILKFENEFKVLTDDMRKNGNESLFSEEIEEDDDYDEGESIFENNLASHSYNNGTNGNNSTNNNSNVLSPISSISSNSQSKDIGKHSNLNIELKNLRKTVSKLTSRSETLKKDYENLKGIHASYLDENMKNKEILTEKSEQNSILKENKENLAEYINNKQLSDDLTHTMVRNTQIEEINEDLRIQLEEMTENLRSIQNQVQEVKIENEEYKKQYEMSSFNSFNAGFKGLGRRLSLRRR
ncbi:uncharacterized protein ASCRUDRAFT_82452 [Ascoidea rubescens DSM 1968]|uniref:Rab-GAP TBC domain-containing protein n=1 Tax=Ascoidea rubescens DSM 1968 TaxID=1344418 RepID=A0A1D2VAV4_9ASCO|nr:hypothetical protein ASCRUDRAFT_82452 [Ascoidea rubescens DSM 1968]ODV58788.1 hypothetical protein ASCRUDRAFT_82452 [Ascoidea rubescens DSM 1968]